MAKSKSMQLVEHLTTTAKNVGIELNENLVGFSMAMRQYAEADGDIDTLGMAPNTVMGAHGALGKHLPPDGYQSLLRVKAFKTPEAKAYIGTNREFWLNDETGETTLMDPLGAVMSIDDVMKFCHLEKIDMSPENDTTQDPRTPVVTTKS